jgi:hypothetical protein
MWLSVTNRNESLRYRTTHTHRDTVCSEILLPVTQLAAIRMCLTSLDERTRSVVHASLEVLTAVWTVLSYGMWRHVVLQTNALPQFSGLKISHVINQQTAYFWYWRWKECASTEKSVNVYRVSQSHKTVSLLLFNDAVSNSHETRRRMLEEL